MEVETVLQTLGIPTAPSGHHHVSEGWIGWDCPRCSKRSGSFRAGTNRRTKYTFCWACGPLKLISSLMEASGRPYSEVKQLVGTLSPHKFEAKPLPSGKLELPGKITRLQKEHRKFLKARNFNPTEIEEIWQVGGIGANPGGKIQWSLYLPIFDLEGREVSWTTRILLNDGQRYNSAKPSQEIICHKNLLYGEHLVKGHAIVINEGPLDAWTIGPGGVATLGGIISVAQLARIFSYPVRVWIRENDPSGKKNTAKYIAMSEVMPGETYEVHLSGKDASRSKEWEIKKLRKRFLS